MKSIKNPHCKKKNNSRKTSAIMLNILIWVYLVLAAMFIISILLFRTSSNGIPAIGNNAMYAIDSDSMNPTIKKGDLIFLKRLNDSEKEILVVNDIIIFGNGDISGDGYNMGRILDVVIDRTGKVSYLTKGDNVPIPDELFSSERVLYKYLGFRIPLLGHLLRFLNTPLGIVLLIIVPLVAIFAYMLFKYAFSPNRSKEDSNNKCCRKREDGIKRKLLKNKKDN